MSSYTPIDAKSGSPDYPDERSDWNFGTIASSILELGFTLLLGSGLTPEGSFKDSKWLMKMLIEHYNLKGNYESLEDICEKIQNKEDLSKYVTEIFSSKNTEIHSLKAIPYTVLLDIVKSLLSHWKDDKEKKINVFDTTISCEFFSVVKDEIGSNNYSHFYLNQEFIKTSKFNIFCLNIGNSSRTLSFINDASLVKEWIKKILSNQDSNVPIIVLGDDFYSKSIVDAFYEAAKEKNIKIIEVNPFSQYIFKDSIRMSISPNLFIQEIANNLYEKGILSLKKYEAYGIPLKLDENIKKVFEKVQKENKPFLLGGNMFSGKTLAVQRLKHKIDGLNEYKHIEIKKCILEEDDRKIYKEALNSKTILEGTDYQLRWVTEDTTIIKGKDIKEKIENWLSSFKKRPFKGKWKIDYVESKLTQEDVQNLCEYFKKRIGTEKKIDKKKEEYYIHLATFGDLRSGIFIPQLFEEIFTKHFDKTTEELEEYRNMEKERERFFQEALGFSLVGTITAETVIDALKGFLVRLADVPYFGLSEVVLVGILSIVNIYGVGKQLGFSRYMKLYTHWNNFPDAKKRIMCNILDEKYNLPPGSSYDFLSLWLSKRSKNDAESESLFKKNLENVFTEKFLNELRDVIKKYPELDKKLKEQDEKIKEIENNISKIEETLEQIRKNQYTTGLTEIKNENELKDQLSNVPQNIVGISSTEADKRINSIVEECKSQATNKIVVLTGEPGAGKTTLLFLVARSLILDGALLYYIREPWNFSPTRFQNMKNAYAICDFTELGSNQFFETLRSLQGKNVELGHIIISVRKAYLTKDQWEFINNDKDARFEVKEVKLEEKILLEIAKKEINSKLKDWINNNIDQIADVLVERSEGLPLYISEAVKMLAIKKNEGKVYDDKMLNELPNNVENMINNIINQEIRRDKKLLVTYYLVRHTHGLLKEYLEAFNNIYGIKEPRFLNESSDRLSLHSWYRDVIDHLPNEYYEIGFDTQTTLNSYLEELMNSINNKKKDPVPDLTKSLNDFYNHKDSANFKDVADLVMFGATKYLVERKIKRSDGKYGFNILSERVDYASINSNSIHFYNRLIGFLVNGYLSGETLKEAMSKDIRPFYCLSVFYASRLFQNKIANAVDDVFLKGTGDSSIITLESMIYFKLSSFILGVYITALTNVLEQLKYFQPNESSSKALLNFLKSEYNEALLYVRKSKHIEAVEEYDKAIKLNPNNPDYHIKKGKMLKLKGQFSEALNELTYALELAPEDPLCLITLAEIMACMDKSQEGIKELSSAIKFKPAIKEMLCSIAHSEIKSDSANNKEKLMLKEFIDSYC